MSSIAVFSWRPLHFGNTSRKRIRRICGIRGWRWRGAYVYGFGSAENFRDEAQRLGGSIARPASRLRRLETWLSTHPPLWVRTSERYYDRWVSTIRLFLGDVFGPLPAFCVSVKEVVQWIRINKWELAKLLVVILAQLSLALLMREYHNYVFSQKAWPGIWLGSFGIFSGVVWFVATILVILIKTMLSTLTA